MSNERADFEAMMTRNVRRMCDRAAKYCGRMKEADKEMFLKLCLEAMWDMRSIVGKHPLFTLWEMSCQAAALSRDRWYIASDGPLPGIYEWRWVLGRHLGR